MTTLHAPSPRAFTVPQVIVTPPSPSPSDPGPTSLLARARRHGRHPYATPSPHLLSPTWTPRSAYEAYEDERDNDMYESDDDQEYISRPKSPSRRRAAAADVPSQPEPELTIGALFAAVFLPLLDWRSGTLDLPMPAHSHKRTRRSPSPVIFVLLLLGSTLAISAALHASAFASDLEHSPNPATDKVGLFFPARGLNRQQQHLNPPASPAQRAKTPLSPADMHSEQLARVAVWDLL